ncbi:MAG: hypothetical protein ABGW82_02435, partial [Paracoccus sp. (in: a-proteobacteria)]
MDFGFTDEQTMLGESLARTLERGGDAAALSELGAGLALMTEEAGGFGGSGPDILMVFRTLGRAAAVTPLLDSVVLGAGILSAAGEADLAEAAASGEARIAVALEEPGQRYDGKVSTRAEGERLSGEKSLVPGAEDATHLIVRATDGLWLVEAGAEGLGLRGYALMDGGRAAEVTLMDTPARRIGDAVTLFLGTSPAALYRSDDLGESWAEIPSLLEVAGTGKWTFPPPPHIPHVKHIV